LVRGCARLAESERRQTAILLAARRALNAGLRRVTIVALSDTRLADQRAFACALRAFGVDQTRGPGQSTTTTTTTTTTKRALAAGATGLAAAHSAHSTHSARVFDIDANFESAVTELEHVVSGFEAET
jgi:hypothetical protein